MMTSVTLLNEAERVTSNPNKKFTPTPTAAVLPKPMTGHFSANGREGCARAHICPPDRQDGNITEPGHCLRRRTLDGTRAMRKIVMLK